MPPIQAFYTYERLGALWGIAPNTVRKWLADLRADHPKAVYVTYRLVGGYRRTAFVGANTVALLQARHFPPDAMPAKRRSADGRTPSRPFTARRPADRQPVTPPAGPAPPVPTLDAAPPIRRLRLPVMPSRYAEARQSRP